MPLARYFIWVGGAMLAVLLIAHWFLPESPDAEKASEQHGPLPLFSWSNHGLSGEFA